MALPPHVFIFPLPLNSPVNSTFKLAELLSLSGLHITFLLTHHIHGRLFRSTDLQSRIDQYPGFRIATISDGLPEDQPRARGRVTDTFDSLKIGIRQFLQELSGRLKNDDSETPRRRVTCIIADGSLGFTVDVANEFGIPVFYIRTISACCLWSFFCLPKLIDSGELPFQGNDLDIPIKGVTGTEAFLRRRDLPGFCRNFDPNDPNIQVSMKEGQEIPRSHGLIMNTFEDLEEPMLSQIRTLCPNLYPVGPLHAHLNARLSKAAPKPMPTSSNTTLWKEDRSCIAWLDGQSSKSVIYVSFGSIAVVTKDQLLEFWHGLVNSGKRFLWVIRPDSVAGEDWEQKIPAEVSDGTKERGYIVGWAPQQEVLAHPAVGGFLTHSGWNSTLESVHDGVPTLCWPYFLDQQVNSRFVGEVWKVGLDMKDTCDRLTIEKTVRDLMEVRREEFQKSADWMADRAKRSLSEGGSSYCNLERLIKDIELMSTSGASRG